MARLQEARNGHDDDKAVLPRLSRDLSRNVSKSLSPSKSRYVAPSLQLSIQPTAKERSTQYRTTQSGPQLNPPKYQKPLQTLSDLRSATQTAEKKPIQPSARSKFAVRKDALQLSKSPSSRIETTPPRTRQSPSRKVKENVNYYRYGREGRRDVEANTANVDNTDPFTDLSGFIVDDDAELSVASETQVSEEEMPTRRGQKKNGPGLSRRGTSQKPPKVNPKREGSIAAEEAITSLTSTLNTLDLSAVPKLDFDLSHKPVMANPTKGERASSLSKTRTYRGRSLSTPEPPGPDPVHEVKSAFVTPPTSPSKPRLKSPSKANRQIPQSPHRQSLDLFWSSEEVNTWNDQHSPRKTPHVQRKGISRFLVLSDDEMDPSDRSTSPSPTGKTMSITVSPSKPKPKSSPSKVQRDANRALAEKRRAFDQVKHQLARDLLMELDQNVCQGKLSLATAQSGGVKIKWLKTLNKTAGRANWRRTNITPDRPNLLTTFANIELAEKVVDCPERLVNTLSHEFCHLVNYEVSNELADPHGKSWWRWVNKTLSYLHSRIDNPLYCNVEITAKHNYKIDYKYVWLCVGSNGVDVVTLESEGCGMEYGRHSKSIRPERERCSRCKGSLLQVKPAPRTRRMLVEKAVNASPRKRKSMLQQLMEDVNLPPTSIRKVAATTGEKERASIKKLEVLDLDGDDSSGSRINQRTPPVALDILNRTTSSPTKSMTDTTEKTTIVDLTESSDVDGDDCEMDIPNPCIAMFEREVLTPADANATITKSPVLPKKSLTLSKMETNVDVMEVIDLTDD